MAIAASRKSMHSVMANTGFGDIVIAYKNGVRIEIPRKFINSTTGDVRKSIRRKLDELTRENIVALQKQGIGLYIGC